MDRMDQDRVSAMFDRLDAEAAQIRAELTAAPDADRQAFLRRRLGELHAAEEGLVFGRIDYPDGTALYIGRRGIRAGREPLLVDWRAPAAAPFYAATAAHPMGLRRRRHLRLDGRRVVSVSDEILDGSSAGPDDVPGDGPLAEALDAPRTGWMRDAVTTLQAEQDAIVRSPHRGITVVQGGPGTGKTVVALHRAAYALFAFPAAAQRGVLVVGPDARFLDYISRVLPSLGENDARLVTRAGIGGAGHSAAESPDLARLKGQAVLAEALAGWVDGRRPVAGREPYHRAREAFAERLAVDLRRHRAEAMAAALDRIDAETAALTGVDLDAAVAADLASLGLGGPPGRADLGADDRVPDVTDAVDRLWPRLTPEQVVEGLLADPPAHLAGLRRAPGAPWTEADLALRDEAASLLDGPPDEVYGHVVVDEAQELTEMDWRAVLRRCPSRSMTVVGDFAQAGPGSTVTGWRQALGDRIELHTLTVNYRTTAEILEYSRDLLARIAPGQELSRSVRHGETPRTSHDLGVELAAHPGAQVITADDVCRGREFGTVLVVDPAGIGANPRDLYVALTRATHRLIVIER
ncbi:AAA family ATPase [Actinoplanes sp. NPDC026619]|uniref:HelD family protein n=1 Tax=Actinoplanes sp. NPDC026619 TaxID=3155798 RepID=UPI0033E42438